MLTEKQKLRVEALKAATYVVSNKGGNVMNLLVEANILFDWLNTGKDPVIEKSND